MNFKLCAITATSAALLLIFGGTAIADPTDDIVNEPIREETAPEGGALMMKDAAGEAKAVIKKEKKQDSVEVVKKGLLFKGPYGNFSTYIGGRLHLEVTDHSNDEGLIERGNPGQSADATDGSNIRRARVNITGKAFRNLIYIFEAELAGDAVSVKDMFLAYKGIEGWKFIVGQQKHAMSMEVQESSSDIMFTERSMVSALTTPWFDRSIGLNAKVYGKDWNVQGGTYGDQFDPEKDDRKKKGNAFAFRGTWAPINEKDKVLHVGANYASRSLDDNGEFLGKDRNNFAYETTNSSNLELLSTVDLIFDRLNVGLLELSAMNGPLSFQSEFAKADIERSLSNDIDFTAWYAQVGYTLTGESRSYQGSDGEFKGLKPKTNFSLKNGTWGAWEVAARYDALDLGDALGGKGKRITTALNWYLSYNVRFMADYSRMFDINNGPITTASGGAADDINIFTLRAQWAY